MSYRALSPKAEKLTRLTEAQKKANLVRVARKILAKPETLNMSNYHNACRDPKIREIFCEETDPDFKLMEKNAGEVHCLAGHAIVEEGAAGFELSYHLGGFRAGELLLGIGRENFSIFTEKEKILRILQIVVKEADRPSRPHCGWLSLLAVLLAVLGCLIAGPTIELLQNTPPPSRTR